VIGYLEVNAQQAAPKVKKEEKNRLWAAALVSARVKVHSRRVQCKACVRVWYVCV
jgi:hypothetical protein